jgi:hypothetical protein
MKSAVVRAAGTVIASGLVVGGIVGGTALANQAGTAPAQEQPRPAAQTVDVAPQPVEQGTVLEAKPQPNVDKAAPVTTEQQPTTTVDSSTADTTTTAATTQEQTVTSDPSSAPTEQATQPADTQTTTAADPTTPATPQPGYTELPTPSPGPHNQGPVPGQPDGQAD